MIKRYKISFHNIIFGIFLWSNIVFLYLNIFVEVKNGSSLFEGRKIELVNNLDTDIDLVFYSKSAPGAEYIYRKPLNQVCWDYYTHLEPKEKKIIHISLHRYNLISQVYADYKYLGSVANRVGSFDGRIIIADQNMPNMHRITKLNGIITSTTILFYMLLFSLYFVSFKTSGKIGKRVLLIFIPVILIDSYHLLKIAEFYIMY